MKNIVTYFNYKEYLIPELEKKRGSKSRLANYLGCQPGFISQVLYGESHFNFEHGILIGKFLLLNKFENDFFLTLLALAKAGSAELKNYHLEKRLALIESSKDFGTQIETKEKLSQEEQMIFYSSWHYTAIHILASVPDYQTIESISNRLAISQNLTKQYLDFLIGSGLIKNENNRYFLSKNRIHLSKKSPLISRHHTNWRLKALDAMNAKDDDHFFYSVTMSLSKIGYKKLKDVLLDFLKESEAIIAESKEEEIYSLNIDLFSV